MSRSAANLILVNGRVESMIDGAAPATAVALRGNQIVAVGADSITDDLRDQHTEVIDLHGAVVLPGLVDGHMHPVFGMQMVEGVDLSACTTLDAVRTALAGAVAALAPDAWLTGWGLDPNVFAGQPVSNAPFADIFGLRPASLTIFDGHSIVVSQEALRRAGVDGPREFRSRSSIACDAQGRPTGHLLEEGAIDLIRTHIPRRSLDEQAASLQAILDGMAATGLTGGHVMDLDGDSLALYELLDSTGRLPLRLRVAPWCRPEDADSGVDALIELQGAGGKLWSVDAVKLFIDGTIDGGTAWLHEPDCHGESTDAYWRDPADYTRAVHRLAAAGVQTATHAIGDAGVAHVLNSIASLPQSNSPIRHRVEHIETIPDELVGRFAELGVTASMQPTHATDYTKADHSDNWSERLGTQRADHGWRCADILATGAVVALGSDWPIAPHDPRGILAAAQNRRSPMHPHLPPVGPGQGLSALAALEGYTIAPAVTAGEADVAGRIAPGYRADLTVLAENPLSVPPDELAHVPIVLTVVDGVVRFRSDSLDT